MTKRNAALEALGAVPAPSIVSVAQARAAPSKADQPAKVMLYLPPKVAWKIKEIALHEKCKAHDLYVRALEAYLRQTGHVAEAELLKR